MLILKIYIYIYITDCQLNNHFSFECNSGLCLQYLNLLTCITQVSNAVNQSQVLLNTTVNNTWTVVPGLLAGATYRVTLRGVTARGVGPISAPLNLTIPPMGATSFPPDIKESTPFDNNTYFIVGISVGAFILFAALAATVFCIYRRRQNNKCPQYYSKGKGKKCMLLCRMLKFGNFIQ